MSRALGDDDLKSSRTFFDDPVALWDDGSDGDFGGGHDPNLGSSCKLEAAVEYYTDLGYGRDEALQLLVKEPRKRLRVGADDKGHVPSELTIWGVWHKYQTDPLGPRFKCHRPMSARPPIPLVLLHEPFLRFMECLKEPPTKEDLSFTWKFWKAVHSREYVEKHVQMVEGIAFAMGDYFGLDIQVSVESNLGGRVAVDAAFFKSAFPTLAAEFKPQLASGDPAFQNMDYLRRLWSHDPRLEDKFQPHSLVVNVSGPQVEIVAGAVEENGKVVWAETLASFSCYPKATGPFAELEASARVWRAVRLFVNEYQPAPKRIHHPVPWPLAGYKDVRQLDTDKLIFSYMDGETQKCAKFCQTYSKKAHEAWADVAPALESVSTVVTSSSSVAAGELVTSSAAHWLIVKMEYLSEAKGWQPATRVVRAAKDDITLIAKLKQRLEQVLAIGQDKGFVHGDYRLANLLLKGVVGDDTVDGLFSDYEVRVIDFEWSGLAGVARFPVLLNPSVEWFNGAGFGDVIAKEHDSWFILTLVEQLTVRKDPSILIRERDPSGRPHFCFS